MTIAGLTTKEIVEIKLQCLRHVIAIYQVDERSGDGDMTMHIEDAEILFNYVIKDFAIPTGEPTHSPGLAPLNRL